MTTKINDFFNLLESLKNKFHYLLHNKMETLEEAIPEIEKLYSENKDMFPFSIKVLFNELYLKNPTATKTLFWDYLKGAYYNYETFISLDYEFLNNHTFFFPDKFKNLFFFTKKLSYNYYTYLTRFYYWHYGRNEDRITAKELSVVFFNYYKENLADFASLDLESSISKLKCIYSYNLEILEKEIKYIYANSSFSLQIEAPEYIQNATINTELEKLNDEYIAKVKHLQRYPEWITVEAMGLKFDYPKIMGDHQHFITPSFQNEHKVTFRTPDNVHKALVPHISVIFTESLKTLINGENLTTPIEIRVGSSTLVYFFKQLYNKGYLIADSKEKISEWIINNFYFYDEGEYKQFKKDTIQRTLMRDCKPPKKEILYSF
ncbi:hypothetical protein [Elizabethkingia anophelis]|uniref:hypothetical protein n=1 Tax=Elizabethkingia anophelis TaxID=1117645 RepID=UPI002225C59D|nr:hypothetical protein [Elizabethkingia anophelis]MCW2462601.1 hypothetical protein [Elizabethkingia anophelis]MCW2466286.1 hypothetical protein [Elizabethkingia anophelis]MCW2469970.1 hypothetical protein [Elizabethkingia anophelis]HBI9689832.1 hypothetical protein [Elizabethkingia anophelis]HBI9693851.1 hypothetical protein [Elizabethkingia anophelis]